MRSTDPLVVPFGLSFWCKPPKRMLTTAVLLHCGGADHRPKVVAFASDLEAMLVVVLLLRSSSFRLSVEMLLAPCLEAVRLLHASDF